MSAGAVPLFVSTTHLLSENQFAVDYAIQCLIVSVLLMLLEKIIPPVALWAIISPLILVCVFGIAVQVTTS